jgi:muramoyltetrapeptide carboxypeptidase
LIRPPPLRPGDTIAVVAPSSPFEPVLAWVGLGFLAKRYRVRFDRGLFSRAGYLAGSDERRRDELARALRDPDVRAIVAARGGYGATRFVHEVDFAALAEAPRWIVGFSDVTALHLEAQRVGVCSLHACHVTSLGRGDARARASFVRALEQREPVVFGGLDTIREGVAEGPLVGGNLTLVHAMAAAGRLALPDGAVLLVEDVTERPYRIDRMLSGLLAGGHFARVGAVVVGEFYACEPGPDRVTVHEVVRERLGRLGVPVVANAPIGHGARNEPVVLGARARVEARASGGAVRIDG